VAEATIVNGRYTLWSAPDMHPAIKLDRDPVDRRSLHMALSFGATMHASPAPDEFTPGDRDAFGLTRKIKEHLG